MAVLDYNQYLSKKASGQAMEKDEFMNLEFLRLSTYVNFPMSAQASAPRLARSGLYYLVHGDSVRCFSCKAVFSGWSWTVSPDEKHRSEHPECLHMLGKDTTNITLEEFNACVSTANGIMPTYRMHSGESTVFQCEYTINAFPADSNEDKTDVEEVIELDDR